MQMSPANILLSFLTPQEAKGPAAYFDDFLLYGHSKLLRLPLLGAALLVPRTWRECQQQLRSLLGATDTL